MKIPGRGLSSAAKKIADTAKPATKKTSEEMRTIKGAVQKAAKSSAPMKRLKKLEEGEEKTPNWMKKDYKPGEHLQGYTKYA